MKKSKCSAQTPLKLKFQKDVLPFLLSCAGLPQIHSANTSPEKQHGSLLVAVVRV